MKVVVISQGLSAQAGGSAFSEASLCATLQKNCATEVLCRAGAVEQGFVRGFGLTGVKEYYAAQTFLAWLCPGHWISKCLGDADVVHLNGHWRWQLYFIARLCTNRGIPYILHPRGMLWVGHRRVWAKKVFNWLLGNFIIQHAARLIALSHFETAQWRPYHLKPDRWIVLPNGISSNPEIEGIQCRRPPKPYFLYLGRVEARKNLLFLVDAFVQYVKDGGTAELVLMGPAERGYDRLISRHIRKKGVQDRVRLSEPIYGAGKPGVLKQAIAVIYPSLGEPFGRVPFETLAAGGIPIVPNESGSAEYLRPFLPFSLYPIDDKKALVSCMRTIELGREEAMQGSVARAREWVARELNWGKITQTVLALYGTIGGPTVTRTDEAAGLEST